MAKPDLEAEAETLLIKAGFLPWHPLPPALLSAVMHFCRTV